MRKRLTCVECGELFIDTPKLARWLESGEVVGVDAILIRCPNGHAMKAQATKRVPMTRRDFDAGKAECGNCGTPLVKKNLETFVRADGKPVVPGGIVGRCRRCGEMVTVEVREAAN